MAMAEILGLKGDSSSNPCCSEWKEKFSKLQQKCRKTEEARSALKQAIAIYEQQFRSLQDENGKLKKAYEEAKLQTDLERKDKMKESAARVSLENEISALKSEISSLSQKGGSEQERMDEELTRLRGCVSDREKEINCLQERFQKEITIANAERTKAVEEKKRANEACERAKAEKSRVDEELSHLKARLRSEETEKNQLKKNLQKERTRADSEKKRADEALKSAKTEKTGAEVLKAEKKNAEKVSGLARDSLEDQNLEVGIFPQGRLSEMETEISKLKVLIDKERTRADSEVKKAETEKKKTDEVLEKFEAEKRTADEQRKLVDVERKKAEENGRRREKLQLEVDELRSKLALEISKSKEANRKLEAERKNVNKEKKKAEKQKKIADMSTKHAVEEKNRADRVSQQLEECQRKYDTLKKEKEETLSSRKVVEVPVNVPCKKMHVTEKISGNQGELVKEKINETNSGKQAKQKANRARNCTDLELKKEAEQKKAAEMYKRQVMAEKPRADKLAQELEDVRQKNNNLNKEIQNLVSSRNSAEPYDVSVWKDRKDKSSEIKLLKKELKLEKRLVKYANKVAELEKGRRKVLEEELHRLKLEFAQFSNRIGLSGSFALCNVGKSHLEKDGNISSKRKFMQTEEYTLHLPSGELLKPDCAATNGSQCFKQNIDCTALSLPMSGTCTESTSGTASKMEPLLGGSNRKLLQSSALDSTMASFSDRQLVGSQGKYCFTNSKPAETAKEKSNLQLSISQLSSEVNRTGYNTVVADNNVKSPLKVRNKEDGHIKKRKRVNTVEPIERLCSEGELCHPKVAKYMSMLHEVLDHSDRPSKEVMCCDYNQHHKGRTCSEEVPIQPPCNSKEQNEEAGTKSVCNNDTDKFGCNDLEVFERMFDGDYMKLLNLDNADEEESYRAAVERPLSPTLPEIVSHNKQSDDIDDSRRGMVNCSSGELPSTSEEINYNKSTFEIYGDSLDASWNGGTGKSNTTHALNACISQAQNPTAVLEISDSREKRTKVSCEDKSGFAHDKPCHYLVVFPETSDNCSLSKIFCTTESSVTRCCTFSQTGYAVKEILSALMEDESLSPKEKVCAFFSVLLNSFTEIALTNFNHVFDVNLLNHIDMFSGQMRKVMSDVETRTIFGKVCDFDELITLIENFIIDGRVLVHDNGSYETPSLSDSKVLLLNDKSILLSLHEASFHQLVFGAILLASFCAVFDRVDFIYEAVYAVSRKIASPLALTFLHVFAHICGEQLFTHVDYSLIMTAIKSIVMYCENENLASDFPSCTKCPFSEGALPMEELTSLLLERVQSFALCGQCDGISGTTTYTSKTVPDDILYNLGDVLSMLELLASKMSWGWVCENIVEQLLKLLEACVMETSAAIFVLLGQMARLGIDANGYEDTVVEKIRVKLTSFISQSPSSKSGLPVQFAVVSALLGTTPLSFQEIVKSCEELPPYVSPSAPTECIRKWFCSLTDDQKSTFFRHLTAGML